MPSSAIATASRRRPMPAFRSAGTTSKPSPGRIGRSSCSRRAAARSWTPILPWADLAGGGPALGDGVINDGRAAWAALDFRRHVPPKSPRIELRVPAGGTIPDRLTFYRPLIGYPEVLYTSLGQTDADRIDIGTFF